MPVKKTGIHGLSSCLRLEKRDKQANKSGSVRGLLGTRQCSPISRSCSLTPTSPCAAALRHQSTAFCRLMGRPPLPLYSERQKYLYFRCGVRSPGAHTRVRSYRYVGYVSHVPVGADPWTFTASLKSLPLPRSGRPQPISQKIMTFTIVTHTQKELAVRIALFCSPAEQFRRLTKAPDHTSAV